MSIETPSIEKDSNPNIEELQRIKLQAFQKDARGTWDKAMAFSEKIEKAYPNCSEYQVFHVLIGSNPPEDAMKKDF